VIIYGFIAALRADTVTESSVEDVYSLSIYELINIPINSASQFSQTGLTVPSSVSLLTPSDWENTASQNINDAISHLNGVMLYTVPIGGEIIKIRGFSLVPPRGVNTVLDGVSLNNFRWGTADFSFNHVGLVGIEKIELVKGPGSVLYGSDAFQGVKSVQTQKGFLSQIKSHVELGSDNFYSAGLSGTSVTKGKYILDYALQRTVQGDQNHEFNYIDPSASSLLTSQRALKSDYHNSFIKLRSNNFSQWQYDVGIYFYGAESTDYPGLGNILAGRSPPLKNKDRVDQESELAVGRIDINYYGFDNLDLLVRGFVWEDDRTISRYISPISIQNRRESENTSGLTFIVKTPNKVLNTSLSFSAGFEKSKILKGHTKILSSTGTIIREVDEAYAGKKRTIKEFSFEAETELGSWLLNYAARLDHYQTFGDQLTPRLGATYLYNNRSAIKLLFGQAFRATTAGEQTGTTTVNRDSENIKPELIDTVELAWMTFTDNYKMNVTIFESIWKDAITIESGRLINRDESRAKGVEIEVQYRNAPWRVDYSTSYVQSKNRTTREDYVAFPEWINNIGVGYELPSLPIDFYWSNRILSNMQETADVTSDDLPTYWQSDLHADYKINRSTDIILNIKNIFNRKNYIPSLQFADEGLLSEELNVFLELKHKF